MNETPLLLRAVRDEQHAASSDICTSAIFTHDLGGPAIIGSIDYAITRATRSQAACGHRLVAIQCQTDRVVQGDCDLAIADDPGTRADGQAASGWRPLENVRENSYPREAATAAFGCVWANFAHGRVTAMMTAASWTFMEWAGSAPRNLEFEGLRFAFDRPALG